MHLENTYGYMYAIAFYGKFMCPGAFKAFEQSDKSAQTSDMAVL